MKIKNRTATIVVKLLALLLSMLMMSTARSDEDPTRPAIPVIKGKQLALDSDLFRVEVATVGLTHQDPNQSAPAARWLSGANIAIKEFVSGRAYPGLFQGFDKPQWSTWVNPAYLYHATNTASGLPTFAGYTGKLLNNGTSIDIPATESGTSTHVVAIVKARKGVTFVPSSCAVLVRSVSLTDPSMPNRWATDGQINTTGSIGRIDAMKVRLQYDEIEPTCIRYHTTQDMSAQSEIAAVLSEGVHIVHNQAVTGQELAVTLKGLRDSRLGFQVTVFVTNWTLHGVRQQSPYQCTGTLCQRPPTITGVAKINDTAISIRNVGEARDVYLKPVAPATMISAGMWQIETSEDSIHWSSDGHPAVSIRQPVFEAKVPFVWPRYYTRIFMRVIRH